MCVYLIRVLPQRGCDACVLWATYSPERLWRVANMQAGDSQNPHWSYIYSRWDNGQSAEQQTGLRPHYLAVAFGCLTPFCAELLDLPAPNPTPDVSCSLARPSFTMACLSWLVFDCPPSILSFAFRLFSPCVCNSFSIDLTRRQLFCEAPKATNYASALSQQNLRRIVLSVQRRRRPGRNLGVPYKPK